MDLAFYTYFYGSNNNPSFFVPEVPTFKYKCYYFTNNVNMFNTLRTTTNWIPILDNKPISEDPIESCMAGKEIKVLPHKHEALQNHSYLCYLDNKLNDINIDFVERYINNYFINKNYALLLRVHQFVNESVWNEFKESMLQERYRIQSDQYRQYIQKQVNNGLSETTTKHCTCNFLIRNMKHEKINLINETWFEHIQECGIQDQISFFFVKQIYEAYIFPFTESQYKTNIHQFHINNITRIIM
jgi:hypothetical protein